MISHTLMCQSAKYMLDIAISNKWSFEHCFPCGYNQSQSVYPNQQLEQNPFFQLLRNQINDLIGLR